MNKEEAMKILQHYLEMEEFNNAGDFLIAIDIVLNLVQKQEKIIDKFSKALVNCVGTCPIDYNDDFENDCENCQDTLEKCWIEFFKKVVDEDVKDKRAE